MLTQPDVATLSQPNATGQMLSISLINASCETHGRGKHLVMDLYLSLLDQFLDSCDQWCHHVALHVLRETGMMCVRNS